jgi:hypothetical protein
MAYWWCLKHNRVEEASGKGWFHGQRLGPFDSPDAATHALQTIHERAAEQDAQDKDWEEGQPG